MPKLLSTFLALTFLALPAAAIVVRHDRDDARYAELGARFPAAATVLPDGSGVLIESNWILTAAHVARGVASRSPRVELEGQEFEVARIFVHPQWTQGAHDIALLQLKRPVPDVTPALLYKDNDEVGQVVTFVGRGDYGTGLTGPQTADRRKRGATNEVDAADDDWIFFDFDRGDAATDLEGVSGPGDSGGPALVIRDGKLYTLGVSVFADGDAGPGHYGVREGYTRVSKHREWIESIVAGESTDNEIAVDTSGNALGGRSVAVSGPAELPDSPAGIIVARYIETYNRNDDSAMADFIASAFEESFRASRSAQEHLALYRRLYDEHFGKLKLHRVVGQDDESLTVLFESSKGSMAEIRFDVATGATTRIAGMRAAVVDMTRD